MPNAQTHLSAAYDLLRQPEIRAAVPWLATDDNHSAFLLGVISPDARAISGHSREETHFFEIPLQGTKAAPEAMLARWPLLRDARLLGKARSAFIAGYMTHLIMDHAWVEMIVMPDLFINGILWGEEHPNWLLYSILMTYLEYRAAERLPNNAITLLRFAQANEWLQFVEDKCLMAWRDHVVEVIQYGGARVISRLFAQSNNLTSEELEAIVLSEERMAAEVYSFVPREHLLEFETEAARRSQKIVISYLSGTQISPGEMAT